MIKNDEEIYSKFPCILRKKLEMKEFEFSEKTKFEYEPIQAFRCIEREHTDNTELSRKDFLSNVEECIYKEKPLRKKRGQFEFEYNSVKISNETKQRCQYNEDLLTNNSLIAA